MCSKRDSIVFLAGAAAFNTLIHLVLTISGTLPIRMFNMAIDKQFNMIAMVISAAITAGLVWWACKLK